MPGLHRGRIPDPKSSSAKMLAAMGVFVAPANRLTRPMAENVAVFIPKISPTSAPEVAPTKRMGTTTPPLPPKFKVTLVKTIFKRKAYQITLAP